MEKQFNWHYNKKTIADFVKSMEESKIVAKGSHKKVDYLMAFDEVCSLTEDEAKVEFEARPKMIMINSEFHDWLETYQGDKERIH